MRADESPAERDFDDLCIEPPPLHGFALDLDRGDRQRAVEPEMEGAHVVDQSRDRHRVAAVEVFGVRVHLDVESVMENVGLSGQRVAAALEPQRLGLFGKLGTRGLDPRAAVERLISGGRRHL